jgi:hypothetical protein
MDGLQFDVCSPLGSEEIIHGSSCKERLSSHPVVFLVEWNDTATSSGRISR